VYHTATMWLCYCNDCSSVVCVTTRLRTVRGGKRFAPPPLKKSRPTLGPSNLPVHWVPELFPRVVSVHGVESTSHLRIVPRLRMSGAIPLPHPYMMSSWREQGKFLLFWLLNYCLLFMLVAGVGLWLYGVQYV
jgi:hypothetical protein